MQSQWQGSSGFRDLCLKEGTSCSPKYGGWKYDSEEVHSIGPAARCCSFISNLIHQENALPIISDSWGLLSSGASWKVPTQVETLSLSHGLPDQKCGSQPQLFCFSISSQSLRNAILFPVFLPNLFLSLHPCFSWGPCHLLCGSP